MSDGSHPNSLHNLAHIANMSHELQVLNQQLNDESPSGNHNNQMTSGSTDSNQLKNGKPKRMACVECRQQKSRCDAHEKHPAPCSRCAKKGLQCNLKSDYKRTYKRARIAQIEKEFSELKKKLTIAQAAELLSKVPSLANETQLLMSISPQPQPQPQNIQAQISLQADRSQGQKMYQAPESWPSSASPYNPQSDQRYFHDSSETNNSLPNTPSIARPMVQPNISDTNQPQEVERFVIPEHALACEEKSIDEVSLSPDIIRALYLEYVDYYHPILPVVDVFMGPERIYRLCPALFWVIMFVSLRRFQVSSQKTLLLNLSPIVKGILAEITISPITRYNPTVEDKPIMNACSVYSVQAFLLYTYWPPITSSLSADSSWNTIGVALFQAIRIGLHTPGLLVSPDNKVAKTSQELSMAQEQAKTWIVCNIVSQSIATAFGFPAFVQFDTSIYNSRKPESAIPTSIQFMMEIAHFEDQVAKALNSNPADNCGLIDPTERLPLLKILSKQLDELELKLNNLPADNGFRKFQLLMARVHLLTYYFMDSSRIEYFELQKGLVRLYNAAIALVNHAQSCQLKSQTFIKYLPGVYILNIWQASCIIGKLSHSSLKKVIDLGSGRQSYLAAISLAAKASVLKHDMAHRSSGIMRNMWQLFATLDEKKLASLGINIRTRMSASVFFDSLYLLREQVGMIILNSRNEQNQENGEEDNDGGSYEDEEEYGYADNNEAVVSDDEVKSTEEAQKEGVSQKSTPTSNASSRTKRQRSLSGTINAESKARRIIQTIPLDPQPIPVHGNRSSLSRSTDTNVPSKRKRKNSDSSQPGMQDTASSSHPLHNSHSHDIPRLKLYADYNHPSKSMHNEVIGTPNRQNVYYSNQQARNHSTRFTADNDRNKGNLDMSLTDMVLNESPIQGGLENLEMDHLDINSDLLWKDVDSVMNDFGFHTR